MNIFKVTLMTLSLVVNINAANATSLNSMPATANMSDCMAALTEVDASPAGAIEASYYVNASTKERVKEHATDVYEHIFYAGETAFIYIIGDGDTDLDLFVYDENGNLVDSDTDEKDTCLCTFKPKWTGKFTVKVKNLGKVYNEYEIRMIQ